jgi:hypothetical protein
MGRKVRPGIPNPEVEDRTDARENRHAVRDQDRKGHSGVQRRTDLTLQDRTSVIDGDQEPSDDHRELEPTPDRGSGKGHCHPLAHRASHGYRGSQQVVSPRATAARVSGPGASPPCPARGAARSDSYTSVRNRRRCGGRSRRSRWIRDAAIRPADSHCWASPYETEPHR